MGYNKPINKYGQLCTGTHIEKVKKDAPIVGLTFLGNTFPTCRMIREVFPTPKRETIRKCVCVTSSTQHGDEQHEHTQLTFRSDSNYFTFHYRHSKPRLVDHTQPLNLNAREFPPGVKVHRYTQSTRRDQMKTVAGY